MKKIIFYLLFSVIYIVISSDMLVAATYYLASNGSDITGNGSFDNPWFSPEKARKSKGTINPGDTVIFKNGTYSYGQNSCLLGYNVNDAGTEANPIIYKAETKGSVILDFGCSFGWRFDNGTTGSAAHIIIDGFTIIKAREGVKIASDNVTAKNVSITASESWPPSGAICTNASGVGGFTTYPGAENFLIENGIVDTMSYDSTNHCVYIHAGSGTIRDSILRNNNGNGIQIQNNGTFPKMGTIYVYRNKVYNISGRHGIYSSAYNSPPTTPYVGDIGNVYVYNNFVWNSGYYTSDGYGITITSPNNQRDYAEVFNNTVYGNNNGIRVGGCRNGGKIVNNIVYNSKVSNFGVIDANILVANNLTIDPIFQDTDASHTNFLMLSKSSPAIDAGTNTGVTTDYFGNIRPYGTAYDIGANEFNPTITPAIEKIIIVP